MKESLVDVKIVAFILSQFLCIGNMKIWINAYMPTQVKLRTKNIFYEIIFLREYTRFFSRSCK